jgi:hypothetical protein
MPPHPPCRRVMPLKEDASVFSLNVKPSTLGAFAGNGVFVESGRIASGQIATFYPGIGPMHANVSVAWVHYFHQHLLHQTICTIVPILPGLFHDFSLVSNQQARNSQRIRYISAVRRGIEEYLEQTDESCDDMIDEDDAALRRWALGARDCFADGNAYVLSLSQSNVDAHVDGQMHANSESVRLFRAARHRALLNGGASRACSAAWLSSDDPEEELKASPYSKACFAAALGSRINHCSAISLPSLNSANANMPNIGWTVIWLPACTSPALLAGLPSLDIGDAFVPRSFWSEKLATIQGDRATQSGSVHCNSSHSTDSCHNLLSRRVIAAVALRDIDAGSELFVDYHTDPLSLGVMH